MSNLRSVVVGPAGLTQLSDSKAVGRPETASDVTTDQGVTRQVSNTWRGAVDRPEWDCSFIPEQGR